MENKISRVEYLTLKGILLNLDNFRVYEIIQTSKNYDYRDTINSIYSLVKKEIFTVIGREEDGRINANSTICVNVKFKDMINQIINRSHYEWDVRSLNETEYEIIFYGFGNNLYLDFKRIVYGVKNNCEKIVGEKFEDSIKNLIRKGLVFEYDDNIGNHIFKLTDSGRVVLWNLRRLNRNEKGIKYD